MDVSEFWSKAAQKYDKVVDLQLGTPMTRLMVRDRAAKEGRLGHLAEFGCGTGFFTQMLAAKADSVVATDISPGMLERAKRQVAAENVTFQVQDCEKTTLPSEAFDTAFMALLIHLVKPAKALAEMRRILKPGGALIIANVDTGALTGLSRLRGALRILYHGITGYRIRPPKGFADNATTGKQLRDLLDRSGFDVLSTEIIRDTSRSSSIPVDYIRALKV